jgi:hypothetical protein
MPCLDFLSSLEADRLPLQVLGPPQPAGWLAASQPQGESESRIGTLDLSLKNYKLTVFEDSEKS